MTTFVNKLIHKKELFILAMMLEMLHLAIWVDFGSIVSRSFMLSHLGLFLLWQPVWRGDEKLSIENTFLFIVFTLALTLLLNLWLLFAWLILLIGFIGGSVTLDKNERNLYVFALSFVVLELLFACVPELANVKIEQKQIFYLLLPILPIFILFFPGNKPGHQIQMVDFIHSITASMLTSLVSLGSLLIMFINETSYFTALTQTSIAIGSFIICISWLISSQSRFNNVTQLWSSFMLNIGTPLEQWLSELSRFSEKQNEPEEFLEIAVNELLTLSWISGIRWASMDSKGEIGEITRHNTRFITNNLSIDIYTNNMMGGALYVHCNLLVQLVENFYVAKLREKTLTQQTHLKAIYETGARITHDIKNLLQSLQAITSIISHDSSGSSFEVSQQVLRKQLPNLTQRLQLALDKLQTPQDHNIEEIYLKDWLSDVKKRNSHNNITYQEQVNGDPTIPVDLFDSVIDNLLENIQTKQINEPDIEVTISVICNEDIICVMVCDSGSMIPDNISRELLTNVINSDNGLGVGLYQASKYAEKFDYDLKLVSNQHGRVCFELMSNHKSD
ncbi:MAG: HAMP domain-containing histidine kinase [Proteobacteria bacterium]|nr:sensor histidine kinase [Pseudomonadota bacterium]NOG60443.1 HAMP domain-containing histidine kinase [Pseudomonadota bacterium]